MEELKSFCSQYNKWSQLLENISAIERYMAKEPLIVVDYCKSIIETICKTILDEINISYGNKCTTNELVKKTCSALKVLENSKTLASSFANVSQNLGQFRNDFSIIAHGASLAEIEKRKIMIGSATIKFMVSTFEQLAIFLITIYQDEYPLMIGTKPKYEDNKGFNDFFDSEKEDILIGGYGPYSASEVLFNVEIAAYNTELQNYKMNNHENNI